MKKTILFVAAALFCLSANADQQSVIEQTASWGTHVKDDVCANATDPGVELVEGSKGFQNGTSYPSVQLDEYIKIECDSVNGEGASTNNGVFYSSGTSCGDWRVYEARGNKITITAKAPAKMKNVVLNYSANFSKGGCGLNLVNEDGRNDSIVPNMPIAYPGIEEGVDTVVIYVCTTEACATLVPGKVGAAQGRIQDIIIEYEDGAAALNNVSLKGRATKVVRDGQIFIRHDEQEVNVLGL